MQLISQFGFISWNTTEFIRLVLTIFWLIKASFQFYNQDYFSQRTRSRSFDMYYQKYNIPNFQALWEGKSLIWVDALLQIGKIPPIMKIQGSLLLLQVRPISKHRCPKVPFILVLKTLLLLSSSELSSDCILVFFPIAIALIKSSLPVKLCQGNFCLENVLGIKSHFMFTIITQSHRCYI